MVDILYPPSRIVETAFGKVQGRRLVHEGEMLKELNQRPSVHGSAALTTELSPLVRLSAWLVLWSSGAHWGSHNSLTEREVDAFQGIPFAAPPIGELRFRKPQPPKCWKGVRETKDFAAPPMQIPRGPRENELKGVPFEDSLYLNVFTPCWEAPEGGFPVMVFIHWGPFIFGETSSYGDIGICENIVSRGIVFVTIQYRLGYLGFMSTGDSVCPGNFGLWDQVEALKWIQLNIEAFGGDKTNVTLVGLSAGSVSVDLLHLSPHSTDLFHKMICMAGNGECRWSIHPDMPAQSMRKVDRLGVGKYSNSEELLAKLRLLPAEEFAVDNDAQVKEDNADFGWSLSGWRLLPESLEILRAKATPKPILTGVTKEEGLLMMPGRQSTLEGLEETLIDATRGCRNKDEMKIELRNRFIGDSIPTDRSFIQAQAGMVADAYFVAAIVEFCRKTANLQTKPVYLYVLEHFNPSIMGLLGETMSFQDLTHGCEIFYLFKKGLFGDPDLTETEKRVMDIYTTACTNFAQHGNPNGLDDSTSDLPVHWDPISKENPILNYVITSAEPKMSTDMFEGRTAAYIEIRNRYK